MLKTARLFNEEEGNELQLLNANAHVKRGLCGGRVHKMGNACCGRPAADAPPRGAPAESGGNLASATTAGAGSANAATAAQLRELVGTPAAAVKNGAAGPCLGLLAKCVFCAAVGGPGGATPCERILLALPAVDLCALAAVLLRAWPREGRAPWLRGLLAHPLRLYGWDAGALCWRYPRASPMHTSPGPAAGAGPRNRLALPAAPASPGGPSGRGLRPAERAGLAAAVAEAVAAALPTADGAALRGPADGARVLWLEAARRAGTVATYRAKGAACVINPWYGSDEWLHERGTARAVARLVFAAALGEYAPGLLASPAAGRFEARLPPPVAEPRALPGPELAAWRRLKRMVGDKEPRPDWLKRRDAEQVRPRPVRAPCAPPGRALGHRPRHRRAPPLAQV